jgi:hypothetical protein
LIGIPVSMVAGPLRMAGGIFKLRGIARLSQTVEKWLSEEIYTAAKIKREYGFEAQTSIAEAIKRQVEFYLKSK